MEKVEMTWGQAAEEAERLSGLLTALKVHNCTNPPHFPPHCGCPAG